PRLGAVTSGPARAAIGLSLCCAAVILALPIPLPLSNFFPAAAILMLALGLLEGDGLMVMAGHAATVGLCVGLYLAWGAAQMGATRLLAWVL
ncbi:MAG TPA: exopolysaccharide biosynthesis protein, partial [Vicinamibacteria bacterium]|nr:exopolysaccharide biosynthesis protein [Vicinamibacteria bacterium]